VTDLCTGPKDPSLTLFSVSDRCNAPATQLTPLGPRCDACADKLRAAANAPSTFLGMMLQKCTDCGQSRAGHTAKLQTACEKFKACLSGCLPRLPGVVLVEIFYRRCVATSASVSAAPIPKPSQNVAGRYEPRGVAASGFDRQLKIGWAEGVVRRWDRETARRHRVAPMLSRDSSGTRYPRGWLCPGGVLRRHPIYMNVIE
jgi:hypothetical protein